MENTVIYVEMRRIMTFFSGIDENWSWFAAWRGVALAEIMG